MRRMKRLFLFLFLLVTAGLLPARADGPDDQYVHIYGLIQAGDALNSSNQPGAAFTKYLEAQTALQQFQKIYLDWNPKVVSFRLNYLASKLSVASAKGPAAPLTTPRPTTTPVVVAPPAAPSLVITPEIERQLAALQEDVRRLQADKSGLESKLKEALAAQPTPRDPRELTKAQQQIRELMKENDLLKSSVPAEKPKPAPALDTKALDDTKRALAEANHKLTEQTDRANALAGEKRLLQGRLDSLARASSDTSRLDEIRKALEEANHKLASQSEVTRKLAAEKDTLQSQVKTLAASAEAIAALRAENELLKKQLADSKTAAAAPGKEAVVTRKLAAAEVRIASLQSDAEILRLEKLALQNRVKTLSSQTPAMLVVTSTVAATVSLPSDLARIKLLEDERNELAKKLEAANKELNGRKGRTVNARIDELNSQIAALRARLEVFEARAVPYTTEELALFKKPVTQLSAATPNAGKKSINSLPSGAAGFVASAQRHFAAKEFDQAEADYLQILRRDENNVYTLANLAAIQLERGNLADAEKNVKKALTGAPDDAYSLSILGYVKFRQEKYDEALDALSRAAKLNPQSAEIQNYLGVTLSHKGLRGPAEVALRKAITIDPNYASAHNNLAVIYITQQPPSAELARWHYEKAKAAGHPRNEELEKAFEKKTPAGDAP
jgi:tetratricopeptide (TPR) repeat protein